MTPRRRSPLRNSSIQGAILSKPGAGYRKERHEASYVPRYTEEQLAALRAEWGKKESIAGADRQLAVVIMRRSSEEALDQLAKAGVRHLSLIVRQHRVNA